MKKIFSIIVLVLLFLSACEKGFGEARIIQIYDMKGMKGMEGRNYNLHQWRTVIECLESGRRFILEGKVGNLNDVYTSSYC